MRPIRVGLTAAITAITLLVPTGSASGLAEAETAKTRVTIGSNQEPPTLNPFVPGGDNSIVELIGQAVWARGWLIDPVANRQLPEVFTQIPAVTNGGVVDNGTTLTITYEIRPEAAWADGTPISGDDLAFTIATVVDRDNLADRTVWEDIDIGSIAVSPRGIAFEIDMRNLDYMRLFEVILPKHAIEGSDFTGDWNDEMWVSAGPYQFVRWNKGERIRLERNPNYWKATDDDFPVFDELVFEFIPEERELRRAFERRDIDVYEPEFDRIDRLEPLEPHGARIAVNEGTIWEHINFQFGPRRLDRNEHSLTEYRRFRRAVAHAIDREFLTDELNGGHIDGLTSFWDTYDERISTGAWDRYDYAPAKATDLVLALCSDVDCGPDGPTLVFTTTSNNDTRVAMADLLRPMIESVGITYVAELEDSQIFFGETLDFGIWDVGEWAWVGAPELGSAVDILDIFDPEGPPFDGSNFYRWGTPDSSVQNAATRRFAELRDLANDTLNEDEVFALLQEAEDIVANEMVILPLYARPHTIAYWADALAGVSSGSHGSGPLTWNVEEWRPPVPDEMCDFDGDGYQDVAFAAPNRSVDLIAQAGEVSVAYGDSAGLSQRIQTWHQNTPGVNGIAEPNERFGSSLACGDFDGDGFSDLASGNPDDLIDAKRTGTVNVLYGGPGGLSTDGDELWHRGRPGVPGAPAESDAFGHAVAAADFNGDGYDDLAVGMPLVNDARGAALVLDGGAAGLTAANTWLIEQGATAPGSAGAINGKPQRTDLFGLTLAAGDIDRDGYAELVIGAPHEGVAGKPDAGQVHVLRGSTTGVTSDKDIVINTNKHSVRGKPTNALFGMSLAVGDFNGDTYLDLAVGAPSARRNAGKVGQAHVFHGNATGIAFDDDQVWHQKRPGIGERAERGDSFGFEIIAVDLNGDGYDDLVLGAPGEDRPGKRDAGQAHVIFGGGEGLSVAIPSLTIRQGHLEASFTEPGDRFGERLAAADINGDGFVDILAGTPREMILDNAEAGRVDAILGNPDATIQSDGRWWGIGREGIAGSRASGDWFGGALAG